MKNMLIGGIVGLLFMTGGFYVGMKLNPPPKPKPAPVADTKPVDPILPPKDPISVDDLRKTSESMMTLNAALKAREEAVNEGEARLKAKEDEFAAERQALDDSHAKFKALFAEFQQRLDLVEANQVDQLHKQADLYASMGDQSIDLIRPMSDAEVTRLFSVMEVKPLSKLVGLWKTKYPTDAPRLMHALDDMARVMPKDKIELSDPSLASTNPPADSTAPNAAPAPADASAPAPADANAPAAPANPVTTTDAAAPDTAAPATPPGPAAPDAASVPATSSAVVSTPDASAPNAPPSLAPPADPAPSQIPPTKLPPDTSLPAGPRPAAASSGNNTTSDPGASTRVGDPMPINTTSDLTTPGATASAPIPDPQENLPAAPTPPIAQPVDTNPATTRAPRALPVTINTAASE